MSTTNAVQSAGAKLYIGGTTARSSSSQYALESWTEVGEITNFGEFGRSYQLVTHNPVGNRQTFKFKGARNDGALQLQVGRAPSDAGQAIVKTALDSDDKYNIKITLDDAPAGSPNEPTTFYFPGLVMSYTTSLNDVNAVVGSNIQIEISGDIIEVAAGT